MGDHDKPFACLDPGCNMKFANEDHLNVHKMKHQMSLTLTPGTGKHMFSFNLAELETTKLIYGGDSSVRGDGGGRGCEVRADATYTIPEHKACKNCWHSKDQTPTPTKFLRNCDEIGLFNELTVPKNPFEEAFKQAAEDFKLGRKTLSLPGSSAAAADNDVLNTPQPKFVFKQESPPRAHSPPATHEVVIINQRKAQDQTVPVTESQHTHHVHTSGEPPPLPGPSRDHLVLPGPSRDHMVLSRPSGDHSVLPGPSGDHQVLDSSSQEASAPLPGPPEDMGSTLAQEEVEGPPAKKRRGDSIASSVGAMEIVVEEHVEFVDPPSQSSSLPASEDPLMGSPELQQDLQHGVPSPVFSVASPVLMAASPSAALALATSPVGTVLGHAMHAASPAANPVGLLKSPAAVAAPQYMIQVMVQTPNGDTVPVHIPAAVALPAASPSSLAMTSPSATPLSVATTVVRPPSTQAPAGGIGAAVAGGASVVVTSVNPVATTSSSQVSSTTGAASSTTKQKLKETLQQNIQQNIFTSNMRVMTEAVDRVTQQNKPRTAGQSLLNPAVLQNKVMKTNVEIQDADTSSEKRMMMMEDDGDERRQKFLERNRAAAARCRQKKKQWVGNLEHKADELQNINSNLQSEISKLHQEVATLKTLLLAHKDCPVTRQQRLAGQLQMVSVAEAETTSTSPPPAIMSQPKQQIILTTRPESLATRVLPLATTSSTATVVSTNQSQQDFKPIVINVAGALEPINLKVTSNT